MTLSLVANFSRTLPAVLAVCVVVLLGGCATSGNTGINAAQRADAQTQLAQKEAAERPALLADNRATHVQLVTQMQQKGLYFASLAHIDALQQRWGADAELDLLRADALRQTGQTANARTAYSQLLATPMKARAAHGLGLLAGRAGDFQGAVGFLQQATQAAPTDADVLNDLGFALMQQGRWADARLPLMKASELASDNPRIWSNVSLFLTLDGQVKQAMDVAESRQLSAVARNQIIEMARSIRERNSGASAAPVAAVSALEAAVQPARSTDTVAQLNPNLTLSFGLARLTALPAQNP